MSIPSPIAAGRLSLRCFRIRSLALLFAVLGLFVTPQAMVPAHAETMQQGWVGDLPIMRGMRIEPELGFAFDSPGGRIVLVGDTHGCFAEFKQLLDEQRVDPEVDSVVQRGVRNRD